MVPSVVVAGEILVEIMARTPGHGFREALDLYGPLPSGAPAIFADQLARQGTATAMIGCVGDDDFGRLNIERLRRDGVDVSAIRIDPAAVTGSAFVRYRPDGQRDFVFNILHSANAGITFDNAARRSAERATHVHVVGSSLVVPQIREVVRSIVEAIKAKGGSMSFDPNARKELLDVPGMREALGDILAVTDLFLPSGEELFLFSHRGDVESAARDILSRGVAALVLKEGASGSRYFDAAGDLRADPVPVQEIDPTGAGDIFSATFVHGWLGGLAPADNLRRANAAGAIAVTRRGPMEGASNPEEIDRRLSSGASAS